MSAEDVGRAVEAIQEQSAKLNALTDEAGELVRQAEEFLNGRCSVGRPCAVPVRPGGDGADGLGTFLAYRRVGPRFRIAVEDYAPGVEPSVKAWGDCARADKLDALAQLPTLLREIAAQLGEDVRGAEASVRAVAGALAALPTPPASPQSNGVPGRHPRFDVDGGKLGPPRKPRPFDAGDDDQAGGAGDIPF